MKPQTYLTEAGKAIFDNLVAHLKEETDLKEIDSYKLSALANALDLHQRAGDDLNTMDATRPNGYAQTTKSNYSQVTASFTVWTKTLDQIVKLSPQFGIDPANREKFLPKKKKSKNPLDGL